MAGRTSVPRLLNSVYPALSTSRARASEAGTRCPDVAYLTLTFRWPNYAAATWVIGIR